MQRILQAGLFVIILLASCSDRSPAPAPADDGREREIRVRPAETIKVTPAADEVVASLPEPTKQERYTACLVEALDFLADKKYAEALAALEMAQKCQDSGQVQREIDRVRAVMDQAELAAKAAQDVRTVLDAGKPEDAARLAGAALGQYGAADAGRDLGALKRQADAVLTAAADDAATRRARLRAEAEAALRDTNLRGAAVSLEQVLALGEDPDLRRQYDDVRERVARYDDCRSRAAVLRKDPAALDEAVAQLEQAARAWDTLQVRQEIDEYRLALQFRRDRISVADFEVRGDVGAAAAGRAVAEELLPHFKPRYDLVERGQISKILDELNLTAVGLTEAPDGRREVARLARVRYLVVGSVTPLAGVTLQARLVEVSSGLVVQTARLSAPSVDALLPRLKHVALMLMMTDEQKAAFEAKCAEAAPVVRLIEVSAEIPPAPPVPTAVVVAPLVTCTPRPPALGGLVIEDFGRLPSVVVELPPPPPALAVFVRREDPRRGRLFALSLELGDGLFRRGRYEEAQRHFQLALNLGGGEAALQLRIDRCRPLLPPPPPVVVAAPVVVRPRMAVFGFVVSCQPGLVPPAVGDLAADQFAGYFGGGYELIDRGEVCWHMGRLGITVREVLTDPVARRCLAQSLNVRVFAFGTIEQTASFNVSTHLLDADSGARTGTGMIHVQDHNEMKLRLHELAAQAGAPKAEQARLARQGAETEKAIDDARKLQTSGQYARAAKVTRAALKAAPNSTALLALQQEADRKAQQSQLEAARLAATRERATAVATAQKKQKELAEQAAAARARAEREAKAAGDDARKAQEQQRARAAAALQAQAKKAQAEGRHSDATAALQSAAALKPSAAASQALAQARAEQERAAKARAAAEQQKIAAAHQKQREAAQAQVKAEKERRAREEAARRASQPSPVAPPPKPATIQPTPRPVAPPAPSPRPTQPPAPKGVTPQPPKPPAATRVPPPAAPKASPPPAPAPTPPVPPPATPKPTAPPRVTQPAAPKPVSPPPAKPPVPPPAAPRPTSPPKPAPGLVYAQQMQAGATYEKQGKYPAALAAYQAALAAMPGDVRATAAIRNVQFLSYMAAARAAHAARRFADAVKGYQEALKLQPANTEAKAALERARAGKP
jgi:tetratricopeptide (TPR) repeat protein